jgi:hypothetical protein
MHCIFTLTLEADYFNEDSEAWEPLLRGTENIGRADAKVTHPHPCFFV